MVEQGPDDSDLSDFYEERAALIEFDGGASRPVAETQAVAQTAREFGITNLDVRVALARVKHGRTRARS
jgi:hypothetical protein